jgi:hypothetical protein
MIGWLTTLECKSPFCSQVLLKFQLYLLFHRFVDRDMFMRFLGMGIGHQDGSANASISDDMDCDPDACEESEEDGDDEIRQGPNVDVGEREDEEDTEDEEEDEEDEEEDQDDQDSEDDNGYDDL